MCATPWPGVPTLLLDTGARQVLEAQLFEGEAGGDMLRKSNWKRSPSSRLAIAGYTVGGCPY